ncbi:MAG TPA: 4Fe-4S double cluster binding domain-containing protein [Clostridia bacterium]|nr:4Fe-4S double cluster binding domain-containing protein [Clostridia bacterium]
MQGNNQLQALKKQLEEVILGMGASFVGFSHIFEKLPERLKKYPYAITFGVRLSDAIIDEIDGKPTVTYFNHYRSVNALIDQISLRALLYLQQNGYNAYTIGASQSDPGAPEPYSGVFPHKTGAVLSGMGWIGKNGLFIHKNFGPRVRLGTILTDAEIPCANAVTESRCSACSRCVDACPAMALTGNTWTPGASRDTLVDAKACSDFMSSNFKHIGRGSVCGVCIKVCPHRCIV